MDYNSLILRIQSYLNKNDAEFIAAIPGIIENAINRIYQEIQDIGFEFTTNDRLIYNNPAKVINFPFQWLKTLSIYLIDDRDNGSGLRTSVIPRSYEFCVDYWPSTNNMPTLPLFYSTRSYNNFYFSPSPDYTYGIEINYIGAPLLNDTNTRNFITDRYPALLLYACLLESVAYVKDDERIPVWTSEYNRAVEDIKNRSTSRYSDRTSKRDND